jgi:hypothetical protein
VRRRRDRGSAETRGRVQQDPADQQPGVRGPPGRAVPGDGDLGIIHVDRIVPVLFGDPGQQPPQRRDPLGPDREADVRVMGGAGQRPGEIPRVGAHRHPARSPRRRGQGGQRAAQQVRRGRARVIGAVAQVGGQHGLRLRPAGHVRAADPLALVVIGHAALLATVDLHVGSVQVDGDRPAGQGRRSLCGQQRQHPAGHRRQSGLYRLPLRRGDPPGQAGGGRGRQPRHRCEQLASRISALPVQPGQEVLPASCAAASPASSSPAPNPRSRCLIGPTAVSSAPITPSRPHNSVMAARPAFAVSAGSGAPIRGCCRDLPARLRILFTR